MLPHCVVRFGLVDLVLPGSATAGEDIAYTKDRPIAIAVFSGLMTDSKWKDAMAP